MVIISIRAARVIRNGLKGGGGGGGGGVGGGVIFYKRQRRPPSLNAILQASQPL